MDATDLDLAPIESYTQMLASPPAPLGTIEYGDELLPITALVVLSVLALFLLHVLGSLRRASIHKLLPVVVLGAYTLVGYTLGLMRASQHYFIEFPVWAVCLLMLLGGTDELMVCNLNDVENWRSFHIKHLLQGGWVVYIVVIYHGAVPEYQVALGGMLLVIVLQSCVRIKSMRMASKSNLLSKNVRAIAEHMKVEHRLFGGERINLKTMEGYRYIVTGEHRPRDYVERHKHASRCLEIKEDIPTLTSVDAYASKHNGDFVQMEDPSIITVERIWRCTGSLLHSESERGLQLKGVCLSMALSKMLNRRFAGCDLAEAELPKTHDFVFGVGGLLEGDKRYERPFRVIEVELGFVHDLYYTRYPYLYRKIRYFALCLPAAMVILCSWLTYQLFKKHKDPINSEDTPLRTTLLLMAVVTLLEVFQLYLHMASGWFKVALIGSYVTKPALRRGGCFPTIISLLLRLKRLPSSSWEDKLGQYSLLQSYNARRHFSRCIHHVTLCLIDKAKKGREKGKPVKLSTQVKKVVIDSLNGSKGHLTNGERSLRNNGVHARLSWACGPGDEMVTHTILVWHIATTICKHQFDGALAKNSKQISALSVENSNVVSRLSTASSLSQYCAYLVAFAPDLLPGHSFDSASMLDKSIEEARNMKPLQGAKTMEEKCEILMSISHPNSNDAYLVVMGARLASQLMDIQDRLRWKVLSDFWAEMMLYIAPCEDAQARAHLEALARGGEFITHLWALLTHGGVLKRA